jgi:hypothetical protein
MPGSQFQLIMQTGSTPGKAFQIEKEETIAGRDLANDIVISDPEVSRRHARFLMREDSVFVEDLGSTNGTFLNDERISSPQQLRLGGAITFGENVVLVFEQVPQEEDISTITPEIEKTPQPYFKDKEPAPEAPAPVPVVRQQLQPVPQPRIEEEGIKPEEEVRPTRRGLPTWLIILFIAIVAIICVIAVTMFLMPESWWCALDDFVYGLFKFRFFDGCPIP